MKKTSDNTFTFFLNFFKVQIILFIWSNWHVLSIWFLSSLPMWGDCD